MKGHLVKTIYKEDDPRVNYASFFYKKEHAVRFYRELLAREKVPKMSIANLAETAHLKGESQIRTFEGVLVRYEEF